MPQLEVLIIGGGQAGLAMSNCLTGCNISHVVIERGKIANRWRNESWDSLRLLTPNYQTRLPNWSYKGKDMNGFMSVQEFISFLENYAKSFNSPVKTGVIVESVTQKTKGFQIGTNAGIWEAKSIVIATGHCNKPYVPKFSKNLNSEYKQLTSHQYKNPNQIGSGRVLIVGGSATGAQIAEELISAGKNVTLSVGRHRRLPRRYRDKDILWWVEKMGIFCQTADPESDRNYPAPQLIGSVDRRSLDVGTLQDLGVKLVGRVTSIKDHLIHFDTNLEKDVNQAEEEMRELLARIDDYAIKHGFDEKTERIDSIKIKPSAVEINLRKDHFETIIWATGYRRAYDWLNIDILDKNGELQHVSGITEQPGVYVLGLRRQRKYNSNFIDGVGADALFLTSHLKNYISTL